MPCATLKKCSNANSDECRLERGEYIAEQRVSRVSYKAYEKVVDYKPNVIEMDQICTGSLLTGDIAAIVFALLFAAVLLALGGYIAYSCRKGQKEAYEGNQVYHQGWNDQ